MKIDRYVQYNVIAFVLTTSQVQIQSVPINDEEIILTTKNLEWKIILSIKIKKNTNYREAASAVFPTITMICPGSTRVIFPI